MTMFRLLWQALKEWWPDPTDSAPRRRRSARAAGHWLPRAAEVLEPRVLLAGADATDADVPSTAEFRQPDYSSTAAYIATLDLRRFVFQGADYTSPNFSASRLGQVLVDDVYDYDFDRLLRVESQLRNIDRQTALAAIFRQVTAGAQSHTERHRLLIEFVQSASNHHATIQPMYPDGTMVTDPLVLLELGEMRCGQVNRLALDLFQSVGYRGRLVQLGGHIGAEVFYDGGWHLVEADILGGGDVPETYNGSIASAAEISRHPELLDRHPAYIEPGADNALPTAPNYYRSDWFISAATFARNGVSPLYYERTGSAAQWQTSRYYGWEHFTTTPATDLTLRAGLPERRSPGAPLISSVLVQETGAESEGGFMDVSLAWNPSRDDGDLAGYRVYVSTHSRGWNYDGPSVAAAVMPFKSEAGAWQPGRYDLPFQTPPDDVGVYVTADTALDLRLPAGEYFITVMPFDAYGESVGRTVYAASEEIRVAPAPASVLEPMGDVTVSYSLDEFEIPVPLDAGASAAFHVSARVEYTDPTAQLAYDLDRQYAFTADRDDYQNLFGRQEKWLRSERGWYFIEPDGGLYKWTGHEPGCWSCITADFVADLGAEFYQDPIRLSEAAPPPSLAAVGDVVQVSVTQADGSARPSLTVNPAAGFVGTLRVHVTADDGQRQFTETFDLHVVNHPPDVPVADAAMSHTQGRYAVHLPAEDADGDAVAYGVDPVVYEQDGYAAWLLDRSLNLRFQDSYYTNWFASHGHMPLHEKWLMSDAGWVIVLPSGEVHRMTSRPGPGTLLGRVDAAYYANPSLLSDAAEPLAVGRAFIDAADPDAVVVVPDEGFRGTATVVVTGDDGSGRARRSFGLTVTDAVPVLDLPDVTASHTQGELKVELPALDADGEPIRYAVEPVLYDRLAQTAYDLDGRLNLRLDGSYYTGWYGRHGSGDLDEKWIQSDAGWLILLPSGELHRATPRPTADSLVAALDAKYYRDPSLLHDAAAPLPVGTARIDETGAAAGQPYLIIDPDDSFHGRVTVQVSAADAAHLVTGSFSVTVVNLAPALDLAPGAMSHAEDAVTLELPAADPEGDPVTYRVVSLASERAARRAFELKEELNLRLVSSYYEDWYAGQGYAPLDEKWIYSDDGWLIILPSGELHRATPTPGEGTLVARLTPAQYEDPALLLDATPPAPVGEARIVDGHWLVIDPADRFAGTLLVDVSASDGVNTVTTTVALEVLNRPPLLDLPDRTLSAAAGPLTLDLPARDADGDAVEYAVTGELFERDSLLAHELDQRWNLRLHVSYFEDWYAGQGLAALGEKWILSDRGWLILLPGGELHRATPTPGPASLVARLDPAYYADPARLHDAPEPAAIGSARIDSTSDGCQLVVTPDAAFTSGVLAVTLSASDGIETVTRRFFVTVT